MAKLQTFYGVDVVLLPDALRGKTLHEQGKVIEINGRESGASFYLTGQMDYYDRAVRELSRPNQYLLIYLDSDYLIGGKDPVNAEYRAADAEETERQVLRHKRTPFGKETGRTLEDRLSSKYKFKTDVYIFYALAALNAGIPTITLQNALLTLRDDLLLEMWQPSIWELSRHLDDLRNDIPLPASTPVVEREILIHPEDICAVLGGHVDFWESSTMYGAINGMQREEITEHKALQYHLHELHPAGAAFTRFLPRTFLYGPGMHAPDELERWIDESDAPLFVRKPLKESHGYGVEFLTRDALKAQYGPPLDPALAQQFYARAALSVLSPSDSFIDRTSVLFQEAVPSMEITDAEGNMRTACARAIVINGKYMGAIWRSSRQFSSDNPTHRYRHNITNGGIALPVGPAENALIGEIAEAAVAGFEEGFAAMTPHKREWPRETFFRDRLRRSAARDGVSFNKVWRADEYACDQLMPPETD